MSGGLADELHAVPLERENQDLKEVIEIAFQITAQLEIDNIVKNVAWSFTSRFQPQVVAFLLPGVSEDDPGQLISFHGTHRDEQPPALPPIAPVLALLEQSEYSQVSWTTFVESCHDQPFVQAVAALGIEMIVPLRTDKGVVGIVSLSANGAGTTYELLEIEYITRIARFAAIALENASLFRQATTDRMTGLFSHHFFEKTLEEEMERARRYQTTFSLVMFDIDHFKRFNDTWGHLQGDRIIREIARLLTQSVRQVDFPARYGGEEFAVILPSVDVKGAMVVAERLRRRVEEHAFPGDGQPLHVTISVGVTEYDPAGTYAASEIVREADKALYQSKERGRNRLTVSPKPAAT